MAAQTKGKVIGRLLVEAKVLTEDQLLQAVELQSKTGQDLTDALVALQFVDYEGIATAVSLYYNVPFISLKRLPISPEAVKLVPEAMARKHVAIPVSIEKDGLLVVMKDVTDVRAIDEMAAHANMRVKPEIGSPGEILNAIDLNYKAIEEIEKEVRRIPSCAAKKSPAPEQGTIGELADAPVVRAIDLLMTQAVKDRASDIHIEPQEYGLRIRFRIDGLLHHVMTMPTDVSQNVISRLKIMAGMNIAEKRRPQDGQFSMQVAGRNIDVRVATIDTVYGEMAVLRILDKAFAFRELDDLGFLPDTLERYQRLLKLRAGVIIVSGPTGSGKTTTLYASVNHLDRKQLNIITIEDPVEYRFVDINQIQVNPRAGLTFASGLRSIMRLDPNVILVGEIRDGETAQMAMQASLTGHLVLTSLHASEAAGVPARLIDLGVPAFLVATAVAGILSQRMVRRVCPHCCVEREPTAEERLLYEKEMGEPLERLRYGTGCTFCAGTGFLGRTVVNELMVMSEQLRHLIYRGSPTSEIRALAIKEGMVPLLKDGMMKVKLGVTIPSEVVRNALTN